MKKLLLLLLLLTIFTFSSCIEEEKEYITPVEYEKTFTVEENNEILLDSVLYKTKFNGTKLFLIDKNKNVTEIKMDNTNEFMLIIGTFFSIVVLFLIISSFE